MTDKDLKRDVWDVEAGVTHHVNVFAALFYLIKVVDYIITFFGCKMIKVLQVDNKGLMAFIVVHTLEALLHLMGSSALANMYHLWLSDVALYLQAGECIVEGPSL